MKILLIGATGAVGSAVLKTCLSNPQITQVVTFTRRCLFLSHPKLLPVIVKDFSTWPTDLLEQHADAAATLWCMGTYHGSQQVDLEYPVAFIEGMGKVLEMEGREGGPMRFVLLSGKFVTREQEGRLWFLERARKLKGQLETAALAYAEKHPDTWRTLIVRPGGIISESWVPGGMVIASWMPGALATMMGAKFSVGIEELAAFMTWLATDGKGEDVVIENAQIARKGRELLKAQQN